MKAMSKHELHDYTRKLEEQKVSLQTEINWYWNVIRNAQDAEERIADLESELIKIKRDHRNAMIQLVYGDRGRKE